MDPYRDAPADLAAAVAAYAEQLVEVVAFPSDTDDPELRADLVERLVRAAGLSAPVVRRALKANQLRKVPGGSLVPFQTEALPSSAESSPLALEEPPRF
jgi:hypothetical protein